MLDSSLSSSLITYPNQNAESNPATSQVVIRSVQSQDLQGLAEVLTHSFHAFKGIGSWLYPIVQLGIYEDLKRRLPSQSDERVCLVALKIIGDRVPLVVGTVEITLKSSSLSLQRSYYPYISNLAVSNSSRRQGIASQLLVKCEQVTKQWGHQKIYLHVLENNYGARSLYSALGYELTHTEWSFHSWIWSSPQRLLLSKKLDVA
jgi:ribosomal protein S18 acetylase RimI-like enzyme